MDLLWTFPTCDGSGARVNRAQVGHGISQGDQAGPGNSLDSLMPTSFSADKLCNESVAKSLLQLYEHTAQTVWDQFRATGEREDPSLHALGVTTHSLGKNLLLLSSYNYFLLALRDTDFLSSPSYQIFNDSEPLQRALGGGWGAVALPSLPMTNMVTLLPAAQGGESPAHAVLWHPGLSV